MLILMPSGSKILVISYLDENEERNQESGTFRCHCGHDSWRSGSIPVCESFISSSPTEDEDSHRLLQLPMPLESARASPQLPFTKNHCLPM